MKKKIFLDFDGVLFNTVKEAYATAIISIGMYTTIKDIDFTSKHYTSFLKYRYLVGPAWNYKYILAYLGEEDFLNKYQAKVKCVQKKDYSDFESGFFQTREVLRNNNFSSWLSLNEAYTFLTQLKPLLKDRPEKFCIVTTKDKATVLKLLETEGIIFSVDSIYDQKDFENYGNKAEIIKKIIDEKAIKKSIFIDDSQKHLEQCIKIDNLQLLQVSWGYISPSDNKALNELDILSEVTKLINED